MPSIRSQPSLQETQNVAKELFARFTIDKFQAEAPTRSVQQESSLENEFHELGALNGYRNPLMTTIGRDLRRISDRFARSTERQNVRTRAQRVDLNSLTYDHFCCLLNELFHNGEITRERIVVLFFFCTDVAIRALTSGSLDYLRKLLKWSLEYIMNSVCNWVYRQGGWEVVLGEYVPRMALTVCAVAATVAFLIYIKKNWSS